MLNTPSLILVTLEGIVTDWSEVQKEKAVAPILVTLVGISINWSDLQLLKALSPMLVTPEEIVTV